MKETDVALRCNIVTLSQEEGIPYEQRTIIDHSSDEISTEDAEVLLKAAAEVLQNETYQFYVGTSYRHCLIWANGSVVPLTPTPRCAGAGHRALICPKTPGFGRCRRRAMRSSPGIR